MAIDYDNEEKQFLDELNDGKFKIARIPNTAEDYQKFEERDLAAYKKYLNSSAFKALNEEASK